MVYESVVGGLPEQKPRSWKWRTSHDTAESDDPKGAVAFLRFGRSDTARPASRVRSRPTLIGQPADAKQAVEGARLSAALGREGSTLILTDDLAQCGEDRGQSWQGPAYGHSSWRRWLYPGQPCGRLGTLAFGRLPEWQLNDLFGDHADVEEGYRQGGGIVVAAGLIGHHEEAPAREAVGMDVDESLDGEHDRRQAPHPQHRGDAAAQLGRHVYHDHARSGLTSASEDFAGEQNKPIACLVDPDWPTKPYPVLGSQGLRDPFGVGPRHHPVLAGLDGSCQRARSRPSTSVASK